MTISTVCYVTCKPCDVIKSKWPREETSPMIMSLCEGRRRKVKVDGKIYSQNIIINTTELF